MKKLVLAALVTVAATLALAAPAHATKPTPGHLVTICHATPPDTAAQGYVAITVDVASTGYKQSGHEDQHDADIIPAYSYTDGDGVTFSYAGKGDQSILENGCVVDDGDPEPVVHEPVLIPNERCGANGVSVVWTVILDGAVSVKDGDAEVSFPYETVLPASGGVAEVSFTFYFDDGTEPMVVGASLAVDGSICEPPTCEELDNCPPPPGGDPTCETRGDCPPPPAPPHQGGGGPTPKHPARGNDLPYTGQSAWLTAFEALLGAGVLGSGVWLRRLAGARLG